MRRFSQRTALVTLNEINITPLLDLAFVLLIIFIIITPSIQSSEEHGMNLTLPQGGGPYQRVNSKNVQIVEIDSRGSYMLNRQTVSLTQLEQKLAAEYKRNPEMVVKIRADENGRNKDFYAVIAVCERHRISKFGLDTESGTRR
jgi:biopolymer transport protein ExbD